MTELLKHTTIAWLCNWINWLDAFARLAMLLGVLYAYETIKSGGIVITIKTPQEAVESMYLDELNNAQEGRTHVKH